MHCFAFHAPPLSWSLARRLQHRLHYDHHVEPGRLDLLFLPIWFLVPNLAVATALLALIFGAGASASALFGMMLAILHYEWVHYVAHIPYQPRTRLGRWIKQYHLRHHFISEKHWFGVSNPTLDGVFGTFHGPDASEKNDPQALFLKRCPDSEGGMESRLRPGETGRSPWSARRQGRPKIGRTTEASRASAARS